MDLNSGCDDRIRRLRYALISRLYHQPGLLRTVARFMQRKPSFARIARVVAGRETVKAVFHRQWSFSTTQAPNMLAGEFVIGMDAGARQKSDRAFLQRVIGSQCALGAASALRSKELIMPRIAAKRGSFDLISDYMCHVVWAALAEALGATAAQQIASSGDGPDKLFLELRWLGAQLIVGSTSPAHVRHRAERAGASLNQRVAAAHSALRDKWSQHGPSSDKAMHCNAMGLMWVAHPATVQACALCMQELLTSRRELCAELSARAVKLDSAVWSDKTFRTTLRNVVLELLGRRPPFPILSRLAPRNASFSVGRGCPPGLAMAGTELILLVVGALADPVNAKAEDDRALMFGAGDRACIAKDHVVEILVSALTGLLILPELRWSHPWGQRLEYDGPAISRMELKFG